jgi:tetratricopeptide (TPR) repeat protein
MHSNSSIRLSILATIIVVLYSCATGPLFSRADKEFEAGLSKFNSGRYEEAIPHFSRAAELDPEYVEAYLYLGRSYVSLQRWIDAVPPLRTAYRLSPSETRKEAGNLLLDALLGAAVSEFSSGNFRTSISYLRDGLALEPGSERVKSELMKSLLALGEKSINEGNFQEAISVYEEVLDLFPTNLEAYLGLGKAYFQNGDYNKAVEAVKNVIGVDPNNEKAMFLLRQILRMERS